MVFEQFTNYPRKLSPWLRISLKIGQLNSCPLLFHTLDALTLNSLLHALTETLTIEALETPPIKLWDIDRQLIKRPSLNRCQWKDFEWQLPTTEHPIHSFTLKIPEGWIDGDHPGKNWPAISYAERESTLFCFVTTHDLLIVRLLLAANLWNRWRPMISPLRSFDKMKWWQRLLLLVASFL